jgi:hypothetical protein
VAVDGFLTAAVTGAETVASKNQLLAYSAFRAVRAQVDSVPSSVVVALPRDWAPDRGGASLLSFVAGAAWVAPTSLAVLLGEPAGAAPQLEAAEHQPGPPARDLAAILERVGNEVAFASLTEQPEAYLERSLPPLLVPLSNAVKEGAPRAAVAQTALVDAAAGPAPVQVVAGSEVNLISEGGMVPVVVENQSNVAVKGLVVKLTAQTHAISVEEPAVLDLSPGQLVTARVPVRALANGVFDVRVDLLAEDGSAVTAPASMTMRVRAEWENVGTAVIGGVLALVLVLGVISTARKRRSARRALALSAAGPPAGAETG